MASTTLYPPIVDSYTAAFISSAGSKCKVYYSLSKFSLPAEEIKAVHFLITRQSSGANVVNRSQDIDGRYTKTGILIVETDMMHKVAEVDNLYYTEIKSSDISSGWEPGCVYKIQMRFSTVDFSQYLSSSLNGYWTADDLSSWLNMNAGNFSEWSTATLTRAIPQPTITISTIGYPKNSGSVNDTDIYPIQSSTLNILGSYSIAVDKENLYTYKLGLKKDNNILEQTDWVFPKTSNKIEYVFKTELESDADYTLVLEYETQNKFKSTANIIVRPSYSTGSHSGLYLETAEDLAYFNPLTSVAEEQSDGRIGLKICASGENTQFDNICIRRADSRTNFTEWSDIAFVSGDVNDMQLIYDYTVESGVWYQYGVQTIDNQNKRSILEKHDPIKREFEYSFLLGKDGKQLRLMLNHTIGSFKTAVSDGKLDTIGGQFPFITRNGNMKYKTFPINGLISFRMDENNLFTSMEEIYKFEEVANLYGGISNNGYDYTYEREFRNKVVEFLENGEAKLFKSPTEGNFIVRLMDVNTTPDAKLSRLISSFSANAHQIANSDYENYIKYGFCTPGAPVFAQPKTETRIGQLCLHIPDGERTDLMPLIVDTYNRTGERNVAGMDEEVVSISDVEILFDDVETSTFALTRGRRPSYTINSSVTDEIKIFNNYFNCDQVTFPANEELSVEGTETVMLNFTYTVKVTPTTSKNVACITNTILPGQIARYTAPGTSLMNQISSKYFYDWANEYRAFSELIDASIEAKPNTVFNLVTIDNPEQPIQLIMSEESVLKITPYLTQIQDIIYVGKIVDELDIIAYPDLAELKGSVMVSEDASADIWVNYIAQVEKGVY